MKLFDWLLDLIRLPNCGSSCSGACGSILEGIDEVTSVLRHMKNGCDKVTALTKAAEEFGASVCEIEEYFADDFIRMEAEEDLDMDSPENQTSKN
jgi:hypothetical protein